MERKGKGKEGTNALVLELAGDVLGRRAGNLDPGLGEEGASSEDKDEVDDGVDGVSEGIEKVAGRRDIVSKASNGDGLGLRSISVHLLLLLRMKRQWCVSK